MTAEDILAFCQPRLARYKIPKRIFFAEEFPLSASGKILKRVIREQMLRNECQMQGSGKILSADTRF